MAISFISMQYFFQRGGGGYMEEIGESHPKANNDRVGSNMGECCPPVCLTAKTIRSG